MPEASAAPLRTELCASFLEPWSSDPLSTRRPRSHCVGPIDEAHARRRAFSYRMQYRGDELVRVDRVTSLGRPDEGLYDCVRWFFTREGDATQVTCEDRAGRRPMRFSVEEDGARVRVLAAHALARRTDLRDFTTWVREFGPDDRVTELRFEREDGSPGLDLYAVHAYAYTYGDGGLEVRARALHEDGTPYASLEGPELARYVLTALGDQLRYEGLDHQGSPRDFSHGWYAWTREYDAQGNELRVVFESADQRRAVLPCGHSGMSYQRDERGLLVLESYLDADLEPRAACHRFAKLRYTRDALGRVALKQFLTEDDRPATTFYGASGYAFVYDGQDRIVERTSLGPDYQPRDTSRNYSVMRTEYASGGVSRREFLHADGTSADVMVLRCVFFAFRGSTGPVRNGRPEHEAITLAQRALADLERDVEFMEVVRRYSDTDGWLGPTTLDPPVPDFLAVLARPLGIGMRTGVERTPWGYYIIERVESTVDLPPE